VSIAHFTMGIGIGIDNHPGCLSTVQQITVHTVRAAFTEQHRHTGSNLWHEKARLNSVVAEKLLEGAQKLQNKLLTVRATHPAWQHKLRPPDEAEEGEEGRLV